MISIIIRDNYIYKSKTKDSREVHILVEGTLKKCALKYDFKTNLRMLWKCMTDLCTGCPTEMYTKRYFPFYSLTGLKTLILSYINESLKIEL